MKKLFIALVILALAGCVAEVGTEIAGSDFYVKNSSWAEVDLTTLPQYAALSSKSVGGVSDLALAEAVVEAYNEETDDDQLVILTEDVPVEESPDVTAYYVKAVGEYYEIGEQYVFNRAYYALNKQSFGFDAASRGYIVFIDKVPETVPVIPPDTRTREEKYALYMVNKYNKIVEYEGFRYEEHIDQKWDAFNGTGPDLGYADIDVLMTYRVKAFELTIQGMGNVPPDTPWRVVYGQIYTEPTETVTE